MANAKYTLDRPNLLFVQNSTGVLEATRGKFNTQIYVCKVDKSLRSQTIANQLNGDCSNYILSDNMISSKQLRSVLEDFQVNIKEMTDFTDFQTLEELETALKADSTPGISKKDQSD